MEDRISPICGTFLGEPQACRVEAVATVEAGARHFAESPRDSLSSTPAVLALVLALGVACVVLSMPTRRNGRRVTTERVTK